MKIENLTLEKKNQPESHHPVSLSPLARSLVTSADFDSSPRQRLEFTCRNLLSIEIVRGALEKHTSSEFWNFNSFAFASSGWTVFPLIQVPRSCFGAFPSLQQTHLFERFPCLVVWSFLWESLPTKVPRVSLYLPTYYGPAVRYVRNVIHTQIDMPKKYFCMNKEVLIQNLRWRQNATSEWPKRYTW